MRVMLVDDDRERSTLLDRALVAEGHQVISRSGTDADLVRIVSQTHPDIILIDVDAPSRDTLESLSQISRDQPRPIVVFATHSDGDTIRRAIRAGVSAYVVDGLSSSRVQPILEVAIARFNEHLALRRELQETKERLADRRDIDRAKGMLMQRRNLAEPEAYSLLRKMAMDRKQRLGEMARALLLAVEVL